MHQERSPLFLMHESGGETHIAISRACCPGRRSLPLRVVLTYITDTLRPTVRSPLLFISNRDSFFIIIFYNLSVTNLEKIQAGCKSHKKQKNKKTKKMGCRLNEHVFFVLFLKIFTGKRVTNAHTHTKKTPSPSSWQTGRSTAASPPGETRPSKHFLETSVWLKRTNRRSNRAALSYCTPACVDGGEECNWFEQAAAPERNPNRVMRHRGLSETLAKVREE